MYCPNCAEANTDDVKYCRACGENLRVVAIAMKRRFPTALLDKIDAYLERKNERLKRDSIVAAVSGLVFLFLSLYHLLKGEGLSFNVVFTFVSACLMFFWSAWDYLVYQRSLSKEQGTERRPSAKKTGELSHSKALPTPPSITEGTTKRLDDAAIESNKRTRA
jgi:zinc-ribbon domain